MVSRKQCLKYRTARSLRYVIKSSAYHQPSFSMPGRMITHASGEMSRWLACCTLSRSRRPDVLHKNQLPLIECYLQHQQTLQSIMRRERALVKGHKVKWSKAFRGPNERDILFVDVAVFAFDDCHAMHPSKAAIA